jgi:hypothetical protein
MILSVNELKQEKKNKHDKNKQIYREILTQVYSKIQQKNKEGYTFLIFLISPIVPGKPLINIHNASIYIYKKLIKGNFKVNIQGNKMYIDWS